MRGWSPASCPFPTNRQPRDGGRRGVTIIELIIVLVIMGIVSVLTVPNLRAWTSRMRLNGASMQLKAAVVNVRKMAVTNGSRYCLSFDGDANFANAVDRTYLITVTNREETAPSSGIWDVVTDPVELAGWTNNSTTELYKGISLEVGANTTTFATTTGCAGLLFNNKGYLDNVLTDFPEINGGRYAKLTLRNKTQTYVEQRTIWIDRGANVRTTQGPTSLPKRGTN